MKKKWENQRTKDKSLHPSMLPSPLKASAFKRWTEEKGCGKASEKKFKEKKKKIKEERCHQFLSKKKKGGGGDFIKGKMGD